MGRRTRRTRKKEGQGWRFGGGGASGGAGEGGGLTERLFSGKKITSSGPVLSLQRGRVVTADIHNVW